MDHTDQNAQPGEQESQPISYFTFLAARSHPNVYKFSTKNTTKPRAQAFTAMSAHHHRALLLGCLDCLYIEPGPPKNLIAKRLKSSFHRINPPHVIAAFKHCYDPSENGLTIGLQSRPPTERCGTLLEQPST